MHDLHGQVALVDRIAWANSQKRAYYHNEISHTFLDNHTLDMARNGCCDGRFHLTRKISNPYRTYIINFQTHLHGTQDCTHSYIRVS